MSTFKHSKVGATARYGDAGPGPKGEVMTASFELDGREFVALNGGPQFTFSPAISFVVNCDSQTDIDEYWARLSDGGETQVCGWLKDRFGVSWQIVPRALRQMLDGADPERTNRVMQAIMTMTKLDLAALERAWRQP